MRKLTLAFLLLAAPAYAEDAPQPVEPAVPTPVAASQPAKSPPAWNIEDLDQSDLANLNACAMELPKRIADPFIVRLQSKLKPVK